MPIRPYREAHALGQPAARDEQTMQDSDVELQRAMLAGFAATPLGSAADPVVIFTRLNTNVHKLYTTNSKYKNKKILEYFVVYFSNM